MDYDERHVSDKRSVQSLEAALTTRSIIILLMTVQRRSTWLALLDTVLIWTLTLPLRQLAHCIWLCLDQLYSLSQPHLLIVWHDQHPSLHDVDRSPVAASPRQYHQSLQMNSHDLFRQNYNSFLVKKVPGGPVFSTEPVRGLALLSPHPSDLSFETG